MPTIIAAGLRYARSVLRPHSRGVVIGALVLWVLQRAAGGARGDRHLDGSSAAGTVRVRSAHLARHPSVIVASEPMDADPGWRPLAPGELLHVDPSLAVRSTIALPEPPAHPPTLQDLEARAAAAQAPRAP